MHSVRVSTQLLVFIAVLINTEIFQFFLTLVCELFKASMQLYSYPRTHNRKHAVFICTGRIIAGYDMVV